MNSKAKNKLSVKSAMECVLAILMGIMLLSVIIQVFTRYLLQSGTAWSEVLSAYSFVWITLVGATLAVRQMEHFDMELFTKHLKGKLAKVIYCGTNILVLIFLFLLIVSSYKQVVITMSLWSHGIKVRMGYIYLIIPICGVIMFCFVVENIVKIIRNKVRPYGRGEE